MRRHPRQDPSPGESRYASGERWWDRRIPIEEYDRRSAEACQEADRVPQDSRTLSDKIRENAWKAAHNLFPWTASHARDPLLPYYEEKPAPAQSDPYRSRKSAEGPTPDDPLPRFEQPQP